MQAHWDLKCVHRNVIIIIIIIIKIDFIGKCKRIET